MKILIIQIRQMGDVLLSAPLAEAIKDNNQKHEVHFLTSEFSKDILTGNPYIDKILLLKDGLSGEISMLMTIRKEKYDVIIDVQRTGRSKRLTMLSAARNRIAFKKSSENFYYNNLIEHTTHGYTVFERLDLLRGINIIPQNIYMPRLFFSSKEMDAVRKYLSKNRLNNFFIVSPTARKKEKMWSAEQFGRLANKIYEITGIMPVIVYGTKEERVIAEECSKYIKKYVLIEKPFLMKEFAALVSTSSFFIGNDSFTAHVAVSQNTKAIVICGPTSRWFLENNKTLLVYKGLQCQPCNDYKSCKFNLLCYKSLKYNEVFEKIRNFLPPQSHFSPI